MSSQPSSDSWTVAIAGARGFVGRHVVEQLQKNCPDIRLIGLSRNPQSSQPNLEMRKCNLFSLKQSENALEGVDIAIYLVHSMLPPTRLSQGSFSEFDFILADNFARAANENGVRKIVFVSGLVPRDRVLSKHLSSRVEVENTLASTGIPTFVLRAGMIIGPGSSSYAIASRLVKRLPVLFCPRWLEHKTQVVSAVEVAQAVENILLEDIETLDSRFKLGGKRVFDLGLDEPVSYRELLQKIASHQNLKRLFVRMPWITRRISKFWIQLITSAPKQLAGPLVDSLEHEMLCDPKRHYKPKITTENYDLRSLDRLIARMHSWGQQKKYLEKDTNTSPRAFEKNRSEKNSSLVTSIQRLPLPRGKDATWVAEEYTRWLTTAWRGLLWVNKRGNTLFFKIPLLPPLLVLRRSPLRSWTDRELFYVWGGLLSRHETKGRLEFRLTTDRRHVIASIFKFEPALPWYLYRFTQAWVHLFVMYRFANHLRKFSGKKKNV